jgi:ABC-2 type transport system permease protein
MAKKNIWIAFWTLCKKEVRRVFRIWPQTILPSLVTTTLYFLIFGSFIGEQLREVQGFSYMQFIVAGLVMMGIITNSFSNVASSFFGNKFQRSIEEMLVAPMPAWTIVGGFCAGGVFRGLAVGAGILGVSLFFGELPIYNLGLVILFAVLTSTLFSLLGLFNGLFAKNFDQISIIPTFVLTPLTYLGGVFYSVDVLPPFWQTVSRFNPVLYMVNGFRYGLLGVSDVPVYGSLGVLVIINVVLLGVVLYMFGKGIGIRN